MSYAVETITALPFGHIIGAPLVAAIDAQAQASKAMIDFILEVGFNPPPPPTSGTAVVDPLFDNAGVSLPLPAFGSIRMVSFTYSETDPNNPPPATITKTITVPLLSIVQPLPLGIDYMTIDFTAKINEAISTEKSNTTTTAKSLSTQAKGGWGPVSGSVKGSISSNRTGSSNTSSKYSTEMNMNIHVRASSDHMPAGLTKMLEIFSGLVKSA